METLDFLRTISRGTRSLVITCFENCLDIEQRLNGNVFRLTTLGNIVNPNDELLMQNIHNFVEFKNCSKIIIAGHLDCRVLRSILVHEILERPSMNFARTALTEIVSGHHCHLFKDAIRERIIIEQNVIMQCRTLLNFKPFKERLDEGSLEIIGLLLDEHTCQQVFARQISYNNIVAMN